MARLPGFLHTLLCGSVRSRWPTAHFRRTLRPPARGRCLFGSIALLAAAVRGDGQADRQHQHGAVEEVLDEERRAELGQPGDRDRQHGDGEQVPQTLGRPGRIAVAPSSAPVKAGSMSSWPTVLWPTWSCACRTIPAKAASVPEAMKARVT